MKTLEHFVGIGKHLDGIESRLNVLAYQYKEVAARNEIDAALIQGFNLRAAELANAAQALLAIDYSPTPPEVPTDPLTGFPIVNGYPQDPETGLFHSPTDGSVLDPQPVL